ncbi:MULTISPECIES: abortive infection family protein [unclassified Desulfovibrio]|uniref:abortive infection family protein n=1 Tax=unclassified Desulfovibrio TaxID=2593640 RepID=UPI000F5F60BD|nr:MULTISPECIES: abortive infection family protein [unclassified Desulfovibrio]RRD71951.1 ATP-dependent RNA helicase HrpA [Desulfovibrio sp. OH1209_COT-279]RRD88164.1 ATP-dependent RNA helicase HrpA [Desulfovibrio sp. OH1186_COT-070]
MTLSRIPRPIIGLVAEIISQYYSHAQLDNLFLQADAPGESPVGNKMVKCQAWLARCNQEQVDGLQVLGAVIEDFMERILDLTDTWGTPNKWAEEWQGNRDKIHEALMTHGLTYFSGGKIYTVGATGAVKSLEQILKNKDLEAAELEFARAMENISIDPPASLTAACAIIESACKLYIEEKGLALPKECSIKPLWVIVANDLGFDAGKVEDNDLRKILTGLSSIVDGIGALRTHAGSAHGRGGMRYKIQPRHARLAVHAAHTLTVFLFESWENKRSS